MMGSPHPKARRAASQEAWPAGLQTFGNVKGGPQYLGATFNKFGAEMAYFRQPWVCAGMVCSTVAVRQLISTFSSLQIILGLRRIRIGIIVWPRCGRTSRARHASDSSDEIRMYKLYSMQRSGNSYKVRLALAFLDAPYHAIEIDILRGESRTPDFLAKNPSGQVPLLEVADGRYLAESNAILWYVAVGTSLAPESRIERAEALQWMFFEQHALEPNIGAAYFWLSLVKGGRDLQTHALEDWMERGYAALQVMENHLKTHAFFAASQLTVADIALYGYTHVADQCDFDLATFPQVRAWLRRVEQTPGFVPMDWRPGLKVTDSASIAADA
jgi:glutathione S-transferase